MRAREDRMVGSMIKFLKLYVNQLPLHKLIKSLYKSLQYIAKYLTKSFVVAFPEIFKTFFLHFRLNH